MPDFLHYDPKSGIRRMFDYDEMTGQAWIRTEQDVESLLRRTSSLRNERICDRKKDFTLYASLPPVVQLEMRKKGIDIYSKDPTMIKRMFQEINANYQNLKTTYKKHE